MTCPECGGNGRDKALAFIGLKVPCSMCDGSGEVLQQQSIVEVVNREQFRALNPGLWLRKPKIDKEERAARTLVEAWVWRGSEPRKMTGLIFERRQKGRIDEFDYVFTTFESDAACYQCPERNRYIQELGLGLDPKWTRDHYVNSPMPNTVYKWTREALLDHLMELCNRKLFTANQQVFTLNQELAYLQGLRSAE